MLEHIIFSHNIFTKQKNIDVVKPFFIFYAINYN